MQWSLVKTLVSKYHTIFVRSRKWLNWAVEQDETRKHDLIEKRIALIERTEARGRLRESEKRLSQNIYERGVDDAGFERIRSKGDKALFDGYSTQEKKLAERAGKLPELHNGGEDTD